MRIAVPSMAPGGLDAGVSSHFGHCEAFTIVTLADGRVSTVEVAGNGHTGHGSCGAPVKQLADAGVNALLVGGIGMRPLEMFRSQGIGVFATRATTVREAVEGFARGALSLLDDSGVCGGGSGSCGGHSGQNR